MLWVDHLALFEIDTTCEVEMRARDEFGWIDGCGPGNGRYKTESKTYKVVAGSQAMAEAWAQRYHTGDGVRNFELKETRRVRIDRLILDVQP